jgi:predicted enzyme related to lactoylglutathione lyase
MTITEVAVTNYPATDLAASRAFYEDILALSPSHVIPLENGDGWVEYEIGLHAFGIGKVEGWIVGPNCALETDDFESTVATLRKAGTPFEKEPFDTPVCRMAVVTDPAGNTLTIHQRKPGHSNGHPPKKSALFSEVAFTSYPATDLAASRAFYENVLGLKPATTWLMDDGSGWIEYELGAHTFAIGKSDSWNHGICCALEVHDFESVVWLLKKAGTTFHLEPFDTPVCRGALIADPAGNKLMIHQRKPGHD